MTVTAGPSANGFRYSGSRAGGNLDGWFCASGMIQTPTSTRAAHRSKKLVSREVTGLRPIGRIFTFLLEVTRGTGMVCERPGANRTG